MYRKLKLNEQYAYFFHVIRKILGVYEFISERSNWEKFTYICKAKSSSFV